LLALAPPRENRYYRPPIREVGLEHPPALGKIPPHGSDAGSYLVGEVFGARSIILLKDVDGIYAADPKTDADAEFIPDIDAAELIARKLPTLPVEPLVLELLPRGKLARGIRIVNGLVPGNLTRALDGEPVRTVIRGPAGAKIAG
jgi:molybdenum storage protein